MNTQATSASASTDVSISCKHGLSLGERCFQCKPIEDTSFIFELVFVSGEIFSSSATHCLLNAMTHLAVLAPRERTLHTLKQLPTVYTPSTKAGVILPFSVKVG